MASRPSEDDQRPPVSVAPAQNTNPARLRALRTELGLSQEQLARRMDVSFATVNRWETGRRRMSAQAEATLADLEAGRRIAPSLQAAAAPAGWVDGPLPDFVGRVAELAELRELLGGARAVCLVGPGGCGKTRLAVALAAEIGGETSAFVSLGAVRDGERVRSAMAAALGIRDQPDAPGRDLLAQAFAGPDPLLILDAVENVPGVVGGVVEELLAAVGSLRIVLTSRSYLNSPSVVSFGVPPMRCPAESASAVGALESDAVALFLARARDRLPALDPRTLDPIVVGELCRRLGGLPLAIELIAGWIATLSVEEILDRRASLLRDRTSGTDVLGDVLGASFELLAPPEQQLLAELTVFVGAFTIDDAAAVTGIADQVLVHGIRALVDASWLQVRRDGRQNRFVLLDPIRDFAAVRLAVIGDVGELARRHARQFTALARDSEDGLATAQTVLWRSRITASWPDLIKALTWSERVGDVDLGLVAAAGLWRWWLATGRLVEGREWLSRFLALAPDEASGPAQGKALAAAAVLAAENGDYPTAAELGGSAIAIFQARHESESAALAATVVGSAWRYLGDLVAARHYFEQAMDWRREIGDRRGVAVSLNNLALLELDDGDLARARELFEESLLLKRQVGEPRAVAIGLANLCDVLLRSRQTDRAAAVIDEAVQLAGELGDRQLMGTLRCNQGDLAVARGDFAAAATRYAEAVESHRAGAHQHDVVVAQIGLARAYDGLGRRAEAVATLRQAEAVASGIANAAHLAKVRAALVELGDGAAIGRPAGITAREAEILGVLGRGLTNKAIAAQLHLSVSTVERHLATIYRKLGLHGRVEAARYAVAQGLTPPP